jgi:3-oxoacyl-[acyl-carrier protein] reductase
MTIAFVECWATLIPKESKIDLELKDKVAVITGGSAGIGLAVAHGLAKEGVQILLCARDEPRVVKMATELATTHGVMVLGVPADLSKPEDISCVITKGAETFGGIDILINNRGIGSNETILNAPDDKWQYYWDLHVMAAVRLARGLVPLMQKRHGGSSFITPPFAVNNLSVMNPFTMSLTRHS